MVYNRIIYLEELDCIRQTNRLLSRFVTNTTHYWMNTQNVHPIDDLSNEINLKGLNKHHLIHLLKMYTIFWRHPKGKLLIL